MFRFPPFSYVPFGSFRMFYSRKTSSVSLLQPKADPHRKSGLQKSKVGPSPHPLFAPHLAAHGAREFRYVFHVPLKSVSNRSCAEE